MTNPFDWVMDSPFPAPAWEKFRFSSIREMLFATEDDSVRKRPVLVGVVNDRATVVTLADLQTAVGSVGQWCAEQRIAAGERVAVVRLPYASELLVAINTLALMAHGVSVVLPMQTSPDSLRHLIATTKCRYVFAPVDTEGSLHASTQASRIAIETVCKEYYLPEVLTPVTFPFLPEREETPPPAPLSRNVDGEILILTTSSTTGPAKLVRYSERSLLTVAESWRTAGLFGEATTGGPSICPLFSHSMGVRNVLHAIWTRRPTLLIPPEWLEEEPHRVVSLLQSWPPRHITAGPALIQALARLGNTVPEARRALKSLAVIVSSGSAWDDATAGMLSNAQIANAYGMTETQQVLSTLIQPTSAESAASDTSGSSMSLGRPLPGVSVAVRFTDKPSQTGRLFVNSPFKAIGYVGEQDFSEWLDTGDLVRLCDGGLEYVGRDTDDFINLGSGLKLSRRDIEQRYQFLADEFRGMVFQRSAGRMGVVLIAFCGGIDPGDVAFQERIRTLVNSFHDRLLEEINDFDLRHTLLAAIGFVSGDPPRTGPGKIDFARVAREQPDLLEALASPTGRHAYLIEIDPLPLGEDSWCRHLLPYVGQLMRAMNLDVEYVDGAGDSLFRIIDGERTPVLDLVGGFGTNLLGHGRSDLQSTAIDMIRKVPMLDQFSRRSPAAALAKILSDRIGRVTGRRYICLLHSTGAEAVEAALKHALFKWEQSFHEWNDRIRWEFGAESPEIVRDCIRHNEGLLAAWRPLVIASQGAYHGRTLGTLSVMSDESQRSPFARLLGARVLFVSRDDMRSTWETLEQRLASEVLLLRRPIRQGSRIAVDESPYSGIIAAIVEPIQGEGGIFEVPVTWMNAIRDARIPLILDEIQCGLGRSGEFPASPGVVANCYLLGKALGGGIGKISATLVDQADYCKEFDVQTGATFSGDSLSCQVAQKVLEIIERDDIPGRALALGILLREKLESVREEFPQVVRKITGRGAMLGVELGTPSDLPRFLREIVCEQPGYFAASYLLHRHAVRILPTLSAPHVLRVEPSAYLTSAAMDQFVSGLRDYCHRIASSDVLGLVQHLQSEPSVPSAQPSLGKQATESSKDRVRGRRSFQFLQEPPAPGARRIGFIFNPIYPAEELLVEIPELAELAIDQRLELAARIQILLRLRPLEMFSKNLFDGHVWLCGIALPIAPETLDLWNRQGDLRLVRQRLDDALGLATKRGCQTVVFGAQTSVVTASAMSLVAPAGIQVSSGNSFTVGVMLSQIEATRQKICMPRSVRLAVVGATGNIGAAILRWFAQPGRWEGEIVMLGRPGSMSRLNSIRDELVRTNGNQRLRVSQDNKVLQSCDLIIVAVSGAGVVLQSHHVDPNRPVLIADVSQPRAVSATLHLERPNVTTVWAGLVRLPEDRQFRLTPHTPPGTCFACAAEGILMGLEPHPHLELRGEIDPQAIEALLQLGQKHGLIDTTRNVENQLDGEQ